MSLRLVYLDKVIIFSLIGFVCFSFFSISLTQISCGIGCLAWVTRCYLTRSWGKQNFPLIIPFLVFVLACFVAVVGSVDFSESYKSLKRLLEVLIFFWAVNCIDSHELRERLTILLIVSATLSTFTGFYTSWEEYSIVFSDPHRAEGTMSVYMTYAGLLMLALLVASGKFIFFPQKNKWLLIAIFMMVGCLLLTFTRQAWLGVVAGIIFLIGFRKKTLLWFLPVILGFIVLISPYAIQDRIHSLVNLNDDNLQRRIALWQGGWLVFKDHPIIGCGFKCIDSVHQDYPDPTGVIKRLRGLHNNFIQLAVDTGLFGLISWISIWVVYFMTLYDRIIAMRQNLTYKSNAMASAAAVLGFLVAGFFETNFYDSEVSMLLYFIMALPFAATSNKTISE